MYPNEKKVKGVIKSNHTRDRRTYKFISYVTTLFSTHSKTGIPTDKSNDEYLFDKSDFNNRMERTGL